MASNRPNVYFLIYFPDLVLVLYSTAPLTKGYNWFSALWSKTNQLMSLYIIKYVRKDINKFAIFPAISYCVKGKKTVQF